MLDLDFDSELYKVVFRNTEHPALITDTDFIVRDVNQACVEFTGYPREELVGNPPLTLFNDPDVYEDVTESLLADEPWEGTIETWTKDDEVIYGRACAVPLFVEGRKRGYGGFFVDLTSRREYERSLKVLNRVLRHDLRNDMNVISGHLELLESAVDDDLRCHIQKAKQRVESTIERAETARELEEVAEQEFRIPKTPVRLDSILTEQVARARDRFEEAEFVLQPVEGITVLADEMLGRVLKIVLENAVVHNDAAQPRVEIRVQETDSSVVVEIADDGPGVEDGWEDLIFGREEYDQLHHGRGISLYFADMLVDKYGGEIWVEDGRLGGATFKIRLERAR